MRVRALGQAPSLRLAQIAEFTVLPEHSPSREMTWKDLRPLFEPLIALLGWVSNGLALGNRRPHSELRTLAQFPSRHLARMPDQFPALSAYLKFSREIRGTYQNGFFVEISHATQSAPNSAFDSRAALVFSGRRFSSDVLICCFWIP